MTWNTTYELASDTPVSASNFNSGTAGNIDHLYDNLPTRATLWHDEATVTAGNALAVTLNASQRYGHWAEQSAAADADTFTHGCVLAAGTYTLYILGKLGSTNGKIDWDVDGVSIVTGQDWYAAGATYNTVKTVSSITISEGKRIVLTGTVNGKNASSSSYEIELTKYWFKQASDT